MHIPDQSQLTDFAHDAILVVDAKNSILYWNLGASKTYGWSAEEAVGHNAYDLLKTQFSIPLEQIMVTVHESGEWQGELEHIRQDGIPIVVASRWMPLDDYQGHYPAFLVINRDITQTKQAALTLEEARVFEAGREVREVLQIRVLQQSVVAELGQRALISSDLPALMQEVATVVSLTLSVEFVKILELFPEQDYLLLRAGVGWKEGLVGYRTESAGLHSQAGYALVSSGPVIVEDLRTETRFSSPPLLWEHRVISGMSVIIQGHEGRFGVLGVHTAQTRIFTYDDIHFIQSVANVLGAAIEQTRLYEAETDARAKAEEEASYRARLLEITTALSQALDLEQVAQLIIDEGVKSLGASTGALNLLVGEDQIEIIYSVGSRTPQDERYAWTHFAADPRMPVTQAIRQREALWLESREERMERYPAVAMQTELYPGAWAILPLLVEDRVFGAMNFAFDENREFRLAERAFMVSLSHQCAQALERARLYEQAQEAATLRERQRIARELHDAVSQTLFSANMIAEALPLSWERHPDKTLEQVQFLHQLTRGAAAEMRTLLTELRPDSVVNAKLENLLKQLAYAMQGRKDISVSVITHGESEAPLPAATQLVFYRVAQESLNNIMKHGQAKQARIRMTRTSDQIIMVITDNGQGFDGNQTSTGMGLSTMRERAESIGAAMDIKSTPGRGTQVKLVWNFPVDSD